ncbi:MAG TPA: AmmeMemoRadiSam system protein B [Victivallales bacterium]|nr:AmmeMemoRadiSam system protein B [Victivallales bacterium]
MKKILRLLAFIILSLYALPSICSEDFLSDISGIWHTPDKEKLSAVIKELANVTEIPIDGEIRALILPHAGYIYSGNTAMKALKTLKQKYKTVIVMGPSHRYPMKDTISVPLITSYSSPIGKTIIDKDKGEKLIASSEIFKDIPDALGGEHSVQIEIPLIQHLLPDSQILLLIVGQLSEKKMKEAGEKLATIWDNETLLVVSSDFIHYGQNFGYTPFKDNIAENIRSTDMKAFDFISSNNPSGLKRFIDESGATICGAVPLIILTYAKGDKMKISLIDYSDSSVVTGNQNDRVSYISAVLFDPTKKSDQGLTSLKDSATLKDNTVALNKNLSPDKLDENDKTFLLSLSRKTIKFVLKNKREPTIEELGLVPTEKTKRRRAAFVTLKINQDLRGCVGEIFPSQPLYMSVIKYSIQSAFNDWRFHPLSKDEFEKIHIEISALTEPKGISSYNEIVLGRDGIILSKGLNRALFLPQVAPEQNWTLKETLESLSEKAGLQKDAWKDGCKYKTFQAEVFGEKK